MIKNTLKEKLRLKKVTYGSWITIGHPLVPEIMKFAGFDWLSVDMEHSSIDVSNLLPLIVSIEANGMVPLVRIGELNTNLIKRVMDAGAYGIIAANVCCKEDADLAVRSVKYPPVGTRGVGLYRAQGYGETFVEYKKWIAEESVVVVQIEHINAVKNIDAIFSVRGIDAYLIGPYDLSASLGEPGVFDSPEMINAMKKVMEVANRYGIVPGFHSVSSSTELAFERVTDGYRFLGFSTDFMLLKDAAKNGLLELRKKGK